MVYLLLKPWSTQTHTEGKQHLKSTIIVCFLWGLFDDICYHQWSISGLCKWISSSLPNPLCHHLQRTWLARFLLAFLVNLSKCLCIWRVNSDFHTFWSNRCWLRSLRNVWPCTSFLNTRGLCKTQTHQAFTEDEAMKLGKDLRLHSWHFAPLTAKSLTIS